MRTWISLRTVLLVSALLSAGACSSPVYEGDDVEIRVVNASVMTFDSVRVGFPHEDVRYGSLPPGGASTYRRVQAAYRYAFVEVWTAGERLVLQPIDFVGESLLPAGRYTYRLGVTDRQYLNLTLIEN